MATNKWYLVDGGTMQRWTRTLKLLAAIVFGSAAVWAQLPVKEISGRVAPNEVRIFLKDTLYRISGTYMIAGTLIIEPGTIVEFLPNGRIIDSVGGRIIADGYVSATYVQYPNGDECDPTVPGQPLRVHRVCGPQLLPGRCPEQHRRGPDH
jgi:hypothetical protein